MQTRICCIVVINSLSLMQLKLSPACYIQMCIEMCVLSRTWNINYLSRLHPTVHKYLSCHSWDYLKITRRLLRWAYHRVKKTSLYSVAMSLSTTTTKSRHDKVSFWSRSIREFCSYYCRSRPQRAKQKPF